MKKLLLILLGPLVLGPTGYFLGQMLAPEPVPAAEETAMAEAESKAGEAHATPQEILYKMPLGKLTVQVMQPTNVLHIVIDMDVYIAGAAEFERLNGAMGRASLRDSAVGILSDMAETTLWLPEGAEAEIDQRLLADDIIRKMHLDFNSLRTAKINSLNTTRNARI